jgi:hypothetical protein
MAIESGNLTVLSAQNLVDCVPFGCRGGFISHAFEYVEKSGINSAANYPYAFEQGSTCAFNAQAVVGRVLGYVKITTEAELEHVINVFILFFLLNR